MGMGEEAAQLRARDLAFGVVVGMALRGATLSNQVVGGDELHAVRAALSMPLRELLVTFRETDHSIPLASLFRLALDLGISLGELELRVPALLASLALLVLAPRWAAPLWGARIARYWGVALAVSPLLVMYGRMVRSYAPVMALATLAVLAFLRWWQTGERRWAGIYALAGALSIWFHVGSGPIVCAPLAVAAGLLAAGRLPARAEGATRRAAWRDLGVVACALAVVGGALLLPAWESLRALVMLKSGAPGASFPIVVEVAQLHAGTVSPVAAVGVIALVVFGGRCLWMRGGGSHASPGGDGAASLRDAACFAIGVPFLHIVGLALLAPKLDSPILAARATLVALPWFALLGAAAVAALHGPGWRRALPGLVVLAIIGLGPLAESAYWRSSFQLHDDYIAFTRERPGFGAADLPGVYGQLDGEGGLVELPWHPFWGFGHAVPAYQEVHRRPVGVSNAERYGRDPRMRWRRHAALSPAALLGSDARYALVHLDASREEERARAAMGPRAAVREQPRHWELLRQEGARARHLLAASWGPPDFEDAEIAAWDLERLRRDAR